MRIVSLLFVVFFSLSCGNKSEDPPANENTGKGTGTGTSSGMGTGTGTATGQASGTGTSSSGNGTKTEDFAYTAKDFKCIKKMEKVGFFFLENKLGKQKEAVAVANSKTGGVFPVGTLIQLVPQEAMVKRKKGFNSKTKDWEFFFLKVSAEGTEIVERGGETVKNQFGGNCFSCHNAADPKWDLICGEDHGCEKLPIPRSIIKNIQDGDARCE